MTIAIAGFQHETNTFAPMLASFHDFEKADGWPGMTFGQDIVEGFRDMNLPITGFVAAAKEWAETGAGTVDFAPILWCSAAPSSFVEQDAFDRIAAMICSGVAAVTDLEAIYLDLHGAMVTEAHEDGEGELLRRLRAVVGPKVPIVISLDLHANVTEAITALSDGIVIYRTYPHLDMAETGARAWALLQQIRAGQVSAKKLLKVPFLLPLQGQDTGVEPNRSLYAMLEERAGPGVATLDLAAGFPPADIVECGGAVVAYGADQAVVDAAGAEIMAAYEAAEARFDVAVWSPAEAVADAMATDVGKPVVLADVQDNPGAGAASDGTSLLRALVAAGAGPAVVAILHDPETAALAHETGEGGRFQRGIGAGSAWDGETPFEAEFIVEALSDGRFDCTGEMYAGARTDLGPMACLRVVEGAGEVRVIVGSQRFQCLDLAILRHLGLEPTAQRILGVKSTVHFRADFAPIAAKILAVDSPGVNPCRLGQVPFRKLRPGVRLGPLGPVFEGPGSGA